MSWICSLPFNHIYTDPSGQYRLCCVSSPLSQNINTTPLADYWNSEELNSLRQEFKTGNLDKVKTLCSKCIDQEENNIESYRQLWSKEIDDLIDGDRHMTFKLSTFGNYCNLSCYMCFPVNSSRRETELKKIGWYENFWPEKAVKTDILEQIKPFLPYTTAFSMMGGEPLLIQSHYDLLDLIIDEGHAEHISLNYTSNLTLDTTKFESYIDKFKHVQMNVSIDGIGKRNDYIRFGSDFDLIVKNMKRLKCDTNVYYTVSILSVFDCNKAIEYFGEIKDFNIVDAPDFLSIRHLPNHLKTKVQAPDKVMAELFKPRDEKQWQKACKYIKDLDKHRGTDVREHFEFFSGI